MSVARTVTEVIRQHVTLEVESIDRLYLNVYQPRLPSDRGVASFTAVTNTSNGNWRSAASPLRPWTMASFPAPTRSGCSNCATACPPRASTPWLASGWHACRTRLRERTALPVTATRFPS